jgi:hypothetical protein
VEKGKNKTERAKGTYQFFKKNPGYYQTTSIYSLLTRAGHLADWLATREASQCHMLVPFQSTTMVQAGMLFDSVNPFSFLHFL